jgi:hypothetical protein
LVGTGGATAGTGGAAAGTGGAAAGTGGTAAGTGGTIAGTGGTTAGTGGAGTGGAANRVGTSGGTASAPDGGLTLEIPPGALAGDTQFTFTPVSALAGLPAHLLLTDGTGYRIDWTAVGFTGGAGITLRFNTPAALAYSSEPDLLEDPFPIVMVQCQDGHWVEYNAILVNAGTMAMDIAQPCLESAGPGYIYVGAGTSMDTPKLIAQPSSVTVAAGDPTQFTVVATGAAPLTYRWRRNGADIAGATASRYTLAAAEPADSGARFSVVVANRYGDIISAEATLTVGPPRVPTWMPSTALGPFATDVDLPQIGSLTGLDFVVWNDAGTLRAKVTNGSYAPVDTLAEPIRGRPRVLTGGNLNLAYIVFIDDSGTSTCAGTHGDRLSAIGVRIGSEGQLYQRSNRIPLFDAAPGDCIAQFSAGLSGSDFTSLRGIVFALTEFPTGQLRVGSGGAVGDAAGNWSYAIPDVAKLTFDANCSGPAFLTADSVQGVLEHFATAAVPPTTAVVTWIANENLCAATLDNRMWSQGSRVFDNAIGDPAIGPAEPVAAIDGAGNALVVASRVPNPQTMPEIQEMTAAFRGAAGGAWFTQQLDRSTGLALPSAVFTRTGSALVVWRPSLASAPTTVYAAVLTAAGAWQPTQRISSSTAADTRFPRICADTVGNALAVYQEKALATDPFTVWARVWRGGLWSAPGRVQDSANEGRFAVCLRHSFNSFLGGNAFVAWRETDPTDATQFRIATAR